MWPSDCDRYSRTRPHIITDRTGKLFLAYPYVVSKTIGYLEHNQPRMDYQRYRQQGLPVTSGLVESVIKQFNRRVKGTEKFWNEAETILQLRASQLSEDGRLSEHLKKRTISPFRQYKATKRRKAG